MRAEAHDELEGMIHILTRGGLGNQMFQYAYALQLQRANAGKNIYLNGISHPFASDNRELSLHHFQLTEKTRICSTLSGSILLLPFITALLRNLGIRGLRSFLKGWKNYIIEHRQSLFDDGLYLLNDVYMTPEIVQTDKNQHLFGFFQTASVIDGIENEIRAAFAVKTKPSEANQAILNEIQSCNAVCLHIRRGDYSLYTNLQVCGESYFTEAVKQAKEELENPVFFVFSTGHDDIEWVREHYHFDAELRYVDQDNVDYEELRLMMNCKHFIISNSTFSWWAAVLSDAAGAAKKVWAPSTWMLESDVQMALPSWKTI